MRDDKQLLLDSKQFSGDKQSRSWFETLFTFFLALAVFYTLISGVVPWGAQIALSITCGLLYVRLFVIYHDFQHRAILQNSKLASYVMQAIGIYLLAPQNIWKRSHDHHHNHNSKLSLSGIGSYPTVSTERYTKLTEKEKRYYLINRHPITILFGYFSLFMYWLNVRSFTQSPKKHLDSLFAIIFHLAAGATVWYFFGSYIFVSTWFFPFFLAFAIGSYLFYCQHNFPGVLFEENRDWKYVNAAKQSTSQMTMGPLMRWFTANIGLHQVHHLNSRIPFYRLKEALKHFPELQDAPKTSWHPIKMFECLQLKLWDIKKQRLITLQEYKDFYE